VKRDHGIIESFGSEGIPRGHLVQPHRIIEIDTEVKLQNLFSATLMSKFKFESHRIIKFSEDVLSWLSCSFVRSLYHNPPFYRGRSDAQDSSHVAFIRTCLYVIV